MAPLFSSEDSPRIGIGIAAALACLVWTSVAAAQLPSIAISLGSSATLGSVVVKDEDIVVCDATSYGEGTTSCSWRLLFDGSAAGLNSSVKALDVLPNGNLVIRVNADSSIPDLSAIKTKDLALFIPTNPASPPYTDGEWRLYLDGDAVNGASDARSWDAVDVLTDGTCENNSPPTCDVLLSLPSGAPLGGVTFDDEDVLRCHPTSFSVGGAITSCDYSLFLDASAINGGGTGSFTGNLQAIDVTASDTLIFRANADNGPDAAKVRRVTCCATSGPSAPARSGPSTSSSTVAARAAPGSTARPSRASPSSRMATATTWGRHRQLPRHPESRAGKRGRRQPR
jgi:hypothetical protein